MSMAFDTAFLDTIGLEGGYVNDPNDPGGETKYGISKRSYPEVDIKNLTLAEAKVIYRKDFWNKLKLDKVDNIQIAGEIFDTAVNMSPVQAVRIIQMALLYLGEQQIKYDGIIGPITLKTLNNWCVFDPGVLFKCLNGFQFIEYVRITKKRTEKKDWKYGHRFSRGWMRRIEYYKEGK